jgi:hypothetical protein
MYFIQLESCIEYCVRYSDFREQEIQLEQHLTIEVTIQ